MSERYFRIIQGTWLILGLYLNSRPVVYALLALLLFEGVTNLRVPKLVDRFRYGPGAARPDDNHCRLNFEAERGLRLIVVSLIIVPVSGMLEILWWLPWFVGFALIGAGLSGICPMVLALRWAGMK